LLEEVASPEPAGLTLLRDAADALSDLDGAEQVGRIHIAEALSYRGETLRRDQAAA
jgi:magnesium chelatase family protein